MRWSVTTPATGTVLTWAQVKAHIRPASVQEQPYLMDLLASATAYAEERMECCLLPQTITAVYDQEDFPWFANPINLAEHHGRALLLPRGPVLSITSVTDTNGNPVAYNRHTAGNAEQIVPNLPISRSSSPITVVYQAGYSTIPPDIMTAIRVHVATIYSIREDVTNLPANPVHKIDDFYRYRGRGSYVA